MKMIHTCIRVLDLDASITFYSSVFGLAEHARFVFETFTLCYLRAPGESFELELTVNHGRTEPYTHGDGYGHLALVVDDISAVMARYRASGATDGEIRQMSHEGELLGELFFAVDPDGYKVEVLSRAGRFADQ